MPKIRKHKTGINSPIRSFLHDIARITYKAFIQIQQPEKQKNPARRLHLTGFAKNMKKILVRCLTDC
jgi:hypothetical protein